MRIFLSTKAHKQLRKIPSKMYLLILSRIEALVTNPFPAVVKKLESRNCWRIRMGDYRILYTINSEKKEITILSVAHRKEAYRL